MTQQEALDILKMGHNVFLTGAAGSGKTYTLRAYISYLKEHGVDVAITASTGIAATHLGGMTIHAWSGLGIRDTLSEQDIDDLETRQYLWKRYEATKVLLIDEISMLHHFRFDLLDRLCKAFKRNDLPFGGIQIILCGDFFQLPPITRQGEPPAYFAYHSNAWKNMNLKICYLEEQHRQQDKAFLSVLNAIRTNTVDEDTYDTLQTRFNKEPECSVPPTKLSSHNENVDVINTKELSEIKGDAKVYTMNSRGNPNLVLTLKKSCLAPESLVIKVGARVMFVKNNYEKGYVNGTLGVVMAFDSQGNPQVKTTSGKTITAMTENWSVEEDGKVKAEIIQIPLRLAWAITIHKSQGMSLDAAEIDLSKSFVVGMGYVALSRVRSLSGIKLLGLNGTALQVHPEVLEVDQSLKRSSFDALAMLEDLGRDTIIKTQEVFIAKNGKTKKALADDLATHHKTKLLIMRKLPIEEIAKERELKADTIIAHIEKLIEEKELMDIEYLKQLSFTNIRFDKIQTAFAASFKKHGDYRLAPVKAELGSKFSYDEIRLARLFLEQEEVEIF